MIFRLGLVPLAVAAKEPAAAPKAYTGLYLREEVQMESIVRRVGDFSRFLESASFSHGAVLNISDVARDCQANRKTAESYFSILEDLMLAFRVPVFTKRAKRHLASHPKFFFLTPVYSDPFGPQAPMINRRKSMALRWRA